MQSVTVLSPIVAQSENASWPPSWLPAYSWEGLLLAAGLFAATFVISLLVIGVLLVRLPATFFLDSHSRDFWRDRHPVWRWSGTIAKNVLGVALIVLGAVLSLPGIPGQGLLTILVGVILIDFPGKRRLERAILCRRAVFVRVNGLRARFGKPPLLIEEPMPRKSSVDEIRARFDQDVERFSNLETGQAAAIDAPTALELIAQAANAATPHAAHILDVGCGAGNFSLRLLGVSPARQVTLLDLSRPMLDRAIERIREAHGIEARAVQGDLREVPLEPEQFDVVLAGAVLHHLRDDTQWETTFRKLFQTIRPGGSLWIFDLVTASTPAIQQLQQQRYGEYLQAIQDEAYRDSVLGYIDQEDTPRSLVYQLDLLRQVGFGAVEVLHVNTCFAAFGGLKTDNAI